MIVSFALSKIFLKMKNEKKKEKKNSRNAQSVEWQH